MKNKYLLVYRTSAAAEQTAPSPEEMQAVLEQWHQWKTQFPDILDMGEGLRQAEQLRAEPRRWSAVICRPGAT